MQALVAAGADVLELGVPFSDPMADGPVIQRSSERALARGAGLSYVFDCVRDFRARDDATPVVLMGYLNPVEIRGAERFAADAAAAGVDGVLLVDLPPEEAGELRAAFAGHGLALISLAAPTTSDARMQRLCADARGYLYYVSYAGVTGAGRIDAVAAHGPAAGHPRPRFGAGGGRLRHQGCGDRRSDGGRCRRRRRRQRPGRGDRRRERPGTGRLARRRFPGPAARSPRRAVPA